MPNDSGIDIFVALHCSDDDSHVIVEINRVVYDDELKVGEKVHFDFPGCKKLQTGTVKGISEDYDSMVKLVQDLNKLTKPKRDGSFHESQPRRAAMRCKETGFGGAINRPKGGGSAGQSVKSTKQKAARPEPLSKSSKVQGKAGAKNKSVPVLPSSTRSVLSKVLSSSKANDSSSDSSSESSDDMNPPSKIRKVNPLDSTELECDYDNNNGAEGLVTTEDDKNDSDDSDDSVLSEEQIKLLQKIAKKTKFVDIQSLINSATPKEVSGAKRGDLQDNDEPISSVSDDGTSVLNSKQQPKSSNTNVNAVEVSPEAIEDGTDQSSTNLAAKVKKPTKAFKLLPTTPVTPRASLLKKKSLYSSEKYNIIEFQGESLEIVPDDVKEKEKDDGTTCLVLKHDESVVVVKLMPDYNVFLLEKDLKSLKNKCGSPSHLARSLTRCIFTEESRRLCSVSGKPSAQKGPDGKKEVRTALSSKGVAAIIEFVQARAAKKTWKVPEDSIVKQHMGNLLCEERNAHKLAAEAAGGITGDEASDVGGGSAHDGVKPPGSNEP